MSSSDDFLVYCTTRTQLGHINHNENDKMRWMKWANEVDEMKIK